MPKFYDLCIRNNSGEVAELASELGWISPDEIETVFLEADDWGELKRKIRSKRELADVLVFKGGDEELNRKAASDSRVDVLLHPEKGRKDSGINHVIAEEASNNRVAIGFDLQQLMESKKQQTHVLKHWRRNLKLCEKYDTPYIITSGARQKYDLRAPRDLKSVITSLGFESGIAVKDHPREILERSGTVDSEGFVRPGTEVEE